MRADGLRASAFRRARRRESRRSRRGIGTPAISRPDRVGEDGQRPGQQSALPRPPAVARDRGALRFVRGRAGGAGGPAGRQGTTSNPNAKMSARTPSRVAVGFASGSTEAGATTVSQFAAICRQIGADEVVACAAVDGVAPPKAEWMKSFPGPARSGSDVGVPRIRLARNVPWIAQTRDRSGRDEASKMKRRRMGRRVPSSRRSILAK